MCYPFRTRIGGGTNDARHAHDTAADYSVVFEGEKREFVIAEWPEGEGLPATVVSMIMDTWTPDRSWELGAPGWIDPVCARAPPAWTDGQGRAVSADPG